MVHIHKREWEIQMCSEKEIHQAFGTFPKHKQTNEPVR